jgi:hypothetical protein
MLKVVASAAAFLSMAVSAASAQTVEFRGGGFLTNPTAACASVGLPEVLYVSTRYRPPTLGDNGPETRFAVFQPLFLASSYTLASGNLNPTLKNVQGGLTGIGTAAFDAKNEHGEPDADNRQPLDAVGRNVWEDQKLC